MTEPSHDDAAPKLDLVGRQMQLKDLAYERLREAIVNLTLPPGTQLREALLSEQLGISKTPIREAFVRLEREGLVEVQPYRGATVRGYSQEDLQEIFELRGLLEGFSASRAAEFADDQWKEELEENIRRSRSAIETGEYEQVAGLLEDFDRLLQSRTENPRVRGLLDEIQSHVERIGRLTMSVPGRLEASVDQHARIAEAILAGHARTAERLMRSHIASVMRTQMDAIA